MSILFPISIASAECSCMFLANSWSTRVSIFSCVLVFASLIGRFSTDEALRLGVICLVESSSEIGPENLNFSFLHVGSSVGKNQMCCLCGWLFAQTDNVLINTIAGISERAPPLQLPIAARNGGVCAVDQFF